MATEGLLLRSKKRIEPRSQKRAEQVVHKFNTPATAAKLFEPSRRKSSHWRTKFMDPDYRNAVNDGAVGAQYRAEMDEECTNLIVQALALNPATTIYGLIVVIAYDLDIIVSSCYIRELIQRLGYSRQVRDCKLANKFKYDNMSKYMKFLDWINSVVGLDIRRLKFLSECRFQPRDFKQPKLPDWRIGGIPKPFTMVLMTSLNSDNLFEVAYVDGNLSQADYLQCLQGWANKDVFKPGDIIIVDNSATYRAEALIDQIEDLLSTYGVHWQTMPTYSPEFSPCRHFFSSIKHEIQRPVVLDSHFNDIVYRPFDEIAKDVLSRTTEARLMHTYDRCCSPYFWNPDENSGF